MPEDPGIVQSLMPIIILFIPLAVIAYKMARRRGRNGWGWALIALLPYFNLIFLLYLASQPEESLLERMATLEERLDRLSALDRVPPRSDPAPILRPVIL